MNNTEHDDDWRAFLYLAGEMSADESAAFELRLAQDQSAREALARTVKLTGAVASVCRPLSIPAFAAGAKRFSRHAVAACTIAALVLVGFLFGFFEPRESKFSKSVVHRTAAGNAAKNTARNVDGLVALWTESSPRDADLDAGNLASAEFDSNCLACLDASDLSVPSWMLAAVAGDPQTKLQNNPGE